MSIITNDTGLRRSRKACLRVYKTFRPNVH